MSSIITSFALISTMSLGGVWFYSMDAGKHVSNARIQTLSRYCHQGVDEACELLDAEYDRLGYDTTTL